MTEQAADQKRAKAVIPYGRQSIDESDIEAVVDVLRSDWLTTGPKIGEFEDAFAEEVGAKQAVAVSNGTAALHAAMFALDIGPGDEVIVPSMTFAATANAVVFQGGTPVFCDVQPDTLLIDPDQVEGSITSRTRGLIAMDYGGQPCDYDKLAKLARSHDLPLVADACHSIGGSYKGRPVGCLADLSVFSFHPVKNLTTAEGGMVTTDDAQIAEKIRRFRNHGIDSDHHRRMTTGTWSYEMVHLGFNYRMTEIQAALGLSQLKRLASFTKRRQEIADKYRSAFDRLDSIEPIRKAPDREHAYHLFVVRLKDQQVRDQLFNELRKEGVFTAVHYPPVHLHPFYRERFGHREGSFPVAEAAYRQILSLPMFPGLTAEEQDRVVELVTAGPQGG